MIFFPSQVISQQTLKERLDLIARQLGLSTQIQDLKISLGTDVFHVDVILGESGLVSSVQLVNPSDVEVSCICSDEETIFHIFFFLIVKTIRIRYLDFSFKR